MQILWNEYGAMILGMAGAIGITAIVGSLLLSDGGVYEALLMFSESIC